MRSQVLAGALLFWLTMNSVSITDPMPDAIVGWWIQGEATITESGIEGLVLEFDDKGTFQLTSPLGPGPNGSWQADEKRQVYEIPLSLLTLPPLKDSFRRFYLPELSDWGKAYLVAWWKTNKQGTDGQWRFDLVVAKKNLVSCQGLDLDWPWPDLATWDPESERISVGDGDSLQLISDPTFQSYCLQFSPDAVSEMPNGKAQLKAHVSSEYLHLIQDFTLDEKKILEAMSQLPGMAPRFHVTEGFVRWTRENHERWLQKYQNKSKTGQ